MNAPVVVPLRVWMANKSRGEIKRFLAGFSCIDQSKEVDEFLHLPFKAQRFAKRNISATHLVLSADQKEILAYYTLVCKPIALNAKSLSDADRRELEQICRLNEKTQCFEFSAYLIAQLGRNFALKGKGITGDELMAGVLMHLRQMRENLGGNVTFVEYEKGNETLFKYYSRNAFVPMSVKSDSTENAGLSQMFRFLN